MRPDDDPARTTRIGRRPGATSSRQAVLEAARARFASDGFTATTIRRVATDAGVDPSQVMQFFGSKNGLFAAAMAVPTSAFDRIDEAFRGPRSGLGERVVRAYLEAWDGVPEERDPLMAMLRGALVNDHAGEQLRDFLQSRLETGGRDLDGETVLRAGLAAAMLIGVVAGRRVIGIPALAAVDTETVVVTIAPAIQRLLTEG